MAKFSMLPTTFFAERFPLMKIRAYLIISLCMVVFLFSPQTAFTENDRFKHTGTFSNIFYHEKAGDLLGVEIRIAYTNKGYMGTLQICEGGAGELTLIKPKIDKQSHAIEFDFSDSFDKGRFSGTIGKDGIVGILNYKGGGKMQETLKRKKSYWD